MKVGLTTSVLLVLVIVGAAVWLWWPGGGAPAHRDGARVADTQRSVPGSSRGPVESEEQRKQVFQTFFEAAFKQFGIHPPSPAMDQLRGAVASKDDGKMLRAFNDLIYHYWTNRQDVITALSRYLSDPDPHARFYAAQALYIIGEKSGYETLIGLIKGERIDAIGGDLRVQAANTLAKYREHRAAAAIEELSVRTDADVVHALCTLGVDPPKARNRPFVNDATAILQYGLVNRRSVIPDLKQVFSKPRDLETKLAAAWSLAKMTGEQQYVDVLIHNAEPAIWGKVSGAYQDPNTMAIRYLGCLDNAFAKGTLERALESPDSDVLRYAVVNLIFNQGGSEKANQLLIDEMRFPIRENKLLSDFAFQVASKVNDARLKAAGARYDSADGGTTWYEYAATRKEWPIYNWIDDYVVELREPY